MTLHITTLYGTHTFKHDHLPHLSEDAFQADFSEHSSAPESCSATHTHDHQHHKNDASQKHYGAFALPDLPYAYDALEPFLSAENLTLHHTKHHKGYIDKVNEAIGTHHHFHSLEDVMRHGRDEQNAFLFNNAAQAWNHDFFWNSMRPLAQRTNAAELEAIKQLREHCSACSLEWIKEHMIKQGSRMFGSGWVWLVMDRSKLLYVKRSANAECPLMDGEFPLLVIDLWEHAYYPTHKNQRDAYLKQAVEYLNPVFLVQNIRKALKSIESVPSVDAMLLTIRTETYYC